MPISTDTSPKAVARSFALRIGPRLAIAFGILLTMMGGLGWFATNALDETARSARLLYQHPFTVTKSLAEVRGDISTLFMLVHDNAEAGKLDTAERTRLIGEITRNMDMAAAHYLGPKADSQAVRDAVAPFIASSERIGNLITQGNKTAAEAAVEGELRPDRRPAARLDDEPHDLPPIAPAGHRPSTLRRG